MIKIGKTRIDTNILLSPLSGCTDLSFRLIAREHGAKFCFYEMVDAHSIVRIHRKTLQILKTHKDDSPIAAQLLGENPRLMIDGATELLKHVKIPFLDINCACPARKVLKKKVGGWLISDPEKLGKLLNELSSSLPLPITVKMRIGYNKIDAKHIAGVAKRCEENGVAALFVHGRTVAQQYSGGIDYDSIKAIKESVKIPVFGVGNIMTPELAKKMFDETGCDGIVIARGALGNPWIFKQTEEYLKTGKVPPEPTNSERQEVLKRHLEYIHKHSEAGAASKVGIMRKTAIWYIKGFPGAAKLRGEICGKKSYEELLDLIKPG